MRDEEKEIRDQIHCSREPPAGAYVCIRLPFHPCLGLLIGHFLGLLLGLLLGFLLGLLFGLVLGLLLGIEVPMHAYAYACASTPIWGLWLCVCVSVCLCVCVSVCLCVCVQLWVV